MASVSVNSFDIVSIGKDLAVLVSASSTYNVHRRYFIWMRPDGELSGHCRRDYKADRPLPQKLLLALWHRAAREWPDLNKNA